METELVPEVLACSVEANEQVQVGRGRYSTESQEHGGALVQFMSPRRYYYVG